MRSFQSFIHRSAISFLVVASAFGIAPRQLLGQARRGPTTVRRDLHHDVSLPLIELMESLSK